MAGVSNIEEKILKKMSSEDKLRLTWQFFELGKTLNKLKNKDATNQNPRRTSHRNRKNP